MPYNYSRYIDNNLLNLCYRPHSYRKCALFCITSVYNYLLNFNDSPNILQNKIGWKDESLINGKIGNKSIINALQKLSKKIKCQILFGNQHITNFYEKDYYILWERLKKIIVDKNKAIIFHEKGHYTLICGYLEEPLVKINSDNLDNNIEIEQGKINRILVKAEHRIRNQSDIDLGILISINFNEIINIIQENRVLCLFECSV
jgi:hypothetical protein